MNKHMMMRFLCVTVVVLILGSCSTVTLVQPYDADLYNKTEEFYKRASLVIAKGKSTGPITNTELNMIDDQEKENHPGHFSKFRSDYDSLLVDGNALILRAMANSSQIDKIGQQMHDKIENMISEKLSTDCDTLQQSFAEVSLTVRNYIDLKCIIGRWQKEHKGEFVPDTTKGKNVLKRAKWEAREKTLYGGILAIQKSQAAKNKGSEQ